MPTIADSIRELADMLDENFEMNVKVVATGLAKIVMDLFVFHIFNNRS